MSLRKHHVHSLAIVLALLASANTSLADAQEHQPDLLTAGPGMLLGRGFDSATGELKADCLNIQHTGLTPQSAQDGVSKHVTSVSDKYDLTRALSVEASASYGFATANVSAKAKFVQDQKLSTYAVNFVALVEVATAWDYAFAPSLIDEAKTLSGTDFRAQCGDRVITGVQNGGEFYAVGQVTTRSESEASSLAASINAMTMQATFDGSFTSDMQKAQQQSRLSINIAKYGGSGTNPTPATLDGITAAVNTFEQDVAQSGGVPRLVMLEKYEAFVPGIPPGGIGSSTPLTVMEQLAALDAIFDTIEQDVQFILAHRDQFKMTPTMPATLNGISTQVQQARTALQGAASSCTQNAGQNCTMPAGLPDPTHLRTQLPIRYAAVCGDQGHEIPITEIYADRRTRGDNDIMGHNPSISLSTTLSKGQNRYINFDLDLTIAESRADWTTYNGHRRVQIFDIANDAPHCQFKTDWAGPRTGGIANSGGIDNHNATYYTGTGLVLSGQCISDTYGSDDGNLECKELTYNPLTLHLAHEEDVVPLTPAMLSGLKLKHWLGIQATGAPNMAWQSKSLARMLERRQVAATKGTVIEQIRPRNFKRVMIPVAPAKDSEMPSGSRN